MTPSLPPPGAPPDRDPDPLIFQWSRRAWPRWRLVPILFVSLLVHAASFYILQVAYTPAGSQLPPPAQVVLLSLDEPQNAPLARWLAMTDPALMYRPVTPTKAQTLGALNFRYTPSYDTALPDFKPLEPSSASDAALSSPPRPYDAGPVPENLLPPLPTPAAKPPPPGGFSEPTRVIFAGAVAGLAPASLPPVRFSFGAANRALDPTVFMVGVRTSGGEPILFRQQLLFQPASGANADAETYAREYLAALPFRGVPGASTIDDDPVVWGWATFYWGKEVYVRDAHDATPTR